MQANEKMTDYFKALAKTTKEMMELNVNTYSKLIKDTSCLEELLQAKKPEDILNVQMKIASASSIDMTKYNNEFYNICQEMFNQTSKAFSDVMHDAANKSPFGKHAKKNK